MSWAEAWERTGWARLFGPWGGERVTRELAAAYAASDEYNVNPKMLRYHIFLAGAKFARQEVWWRRLLRCMRAGK